MLGLSFAETLGMTSLTSSPRLICHSIHGTYWGVWVVLSENVGAK